MLKGTTFAEEDARNAELEKKRLESEAASNGIDENEDIGDEPESRDILELDPKQWKDQDHYAVLGLSALRYKATPDQIKRART